MGQDPGREDGNAAALLAPELGEEHVGGRQVQGCPEVSIPGKVRKQHFISTTEVLNPKVSFAGGR